MHCFSMHYFIPQFFIDDLYKEFNKNSRVAILIQVKHFFNNWNITEMFILINNKDVQ